MPLKVMTIFGTRPEAVKMAPLVKELESRTEIQSICCITAQHRQMLDDVLGLFAITPDYDLDIMEDRQSLYTITSKCLLGLEQVFSREKPDLVLVHGDTSTTFSGALAAFYQKIAVGHVEAGLRTWDRYSPFPEEMNRTLVGDLASLHFCPTPANRENLLQEGIRDGIFVTGNTVIDALKTTVQPTYRFRTDLLNTLDYTGKRVILVTCHRRENYGQPMENIMGALRRLVEDFPEVELVYPVHLSPAVQEVAQRHLSNHERIHLIPPLTPDEMHNLMARSAFVMTDSGRLQRKPRPWAACPGAAPGDQSGLRPVKAGTVRLAGTEAQAVYDQAARLLTDPAAYAQMAQAVNPYGDGQACRRIVDGILWHYGLRETPPDAFSV
mgnify:FL=1